MHPGLERSSKEPRTPRPKTHRILEILRLHSAPPADKPRRSFPLRMTRLGVVW